MELEAESVNSVNNAKESPLHLSAQHGHTKVVAILLAVCYSKILFFIFFIKNSRQIIANLN